NLKIYFSLNQIFIESIMEETDHPEILYTARLIEGEYPEYQEIVPKKFETEIDVYKNEFLQKIKTASLFASKANEIKLKISPKENKIFIFAQNTDFGEIEASMEAQIKGKAMEISFNYKFLEEGIESCDGEKIQIKFTSLEGPAMISSLQDENYFYLLMPIKTS
ncbi:hypothetical protein H5T58_01885, partial [Candidatus Parcubacteria bacterium]|nr:hypothetical protein [Candidatus Parcubacteria bacterium]